MQMKANGEIPRPLGVFLASQFDQSSADIAPEHFTSCAIRTVRQTGVSEAHSVSYLRQNFFIFPPSRVKSSTYRFPICASKRAQELDLLLTLEGA